MSRRILRSLGFSAAVLALWCAGTVPSKAVQQRSEEVRGRLPDDETADQLRKRYYTDKSALAPLVKGEVSPSNYKPFLETAARWYTYRLTWLETRKPGNIDVVLREFDRDVVEQVNRYKDNNQEFAAQFTEEMAGTLRKLLQNDSVINRINGARLLCELGKLGQPKAAELMAETLTDKGQPDAVKYWAMRGLKEMFAAARIRPDDREARCIQALLGYLAAQMNVTDRTLPAEIGGVRYVRHWTLQALGQTRLPQTGRNAPATALYLLRFMATDNITPVPSLDEQIDALAALARMQPKLADDYQPDYAAYHIGLFVHDFARQAAAAGGAGSGTDQWKVRAAILLKALEDLQSNPSDDDATAKYVAGMASQAGTALRAVWAGQPADVSKLREWLDGHKPKNASLFKGNDKAVVKWPTPTEGG